MRHVVIVLAAALICSSCDKPSTTNQSQPASQPGTKAAVAKISRAWFSGPPGGTGKEITVNGEGFDPNDAKALDKIKTTHDGGTNWNSADSIDTCNGSYYKFMSADSSAFPTVKVRVMGTNGQWSDPAVVGTN
jgi:hypothetical protein